MTLPDAYFAGHFDGEGCIRLCKRAGNRRPCLEIAIRSAHLPTLEIYAERVGGSVKKNGKSKTKQMYNWRIYKFDACRQFLEAVLPYSIEKRDQVEACLDWIKIRSRVGQRDRSPKTRLATFALYERLIGLKRVSF